MSEQSSAQAPNRQGKPVLYAALALWAIFAAALMLKTSAAPGMHTVFPKFAAGAEHWWSGQPLYGDYPGLGAFRYSPTFAVVMSPFAWLGLRGGGLAWSLLNVSAYVWAVRRLARDVLPGEWPAPREAALLVMALPAAIRGFWNAQSNPLVAACLMLAIASAARHKSWTAAGLLAGAVYLKLAPIAVALLFIAVYPRTLGWRFMAALAAGGLLPFLTQAPGYVIDQYQGWAGHLAETADHRWPSFRDARMLWEWMGAATDARLYRLLQLLAGMAVLGWCRRIRRRDGEESGRLPALTWSMGVVYLMLFGPAIEFASYPVAAPVAAWVALEAGALRRGRLLAGAAFLVTALFSFGSLERSIAAEFPAIRAALPIGSLLLAGWLVRYGRLAGRAAPAPVAGARELTPTAQ